MFYVDALCIVTVFTLNCYTHLHHRYSTNRIGNYLFYADLLHIATNTICVSVVTYVCYKVRGLTKYYFTLVHHHRVFLPLIVLCLSSIIPRSKRNGYT